jgi:hypothetical protein
MSRLDELKAMLAKSKDKPGYSERVAAIEEEIARLEAEAKNAS